MIVGQDSLGDIATGYRLDNLGIKSWWGRDFPQFSRLWPTQPHIQWVPGLFPGGKVAGHGISYPPSSSAEVKERVEMYLYCPSGPLWSVLGLPLHYHGIWLVIGSSLHLMIILRQPYVISFGISDSWTKLCCSCKHIMKLLHNVSGAEPVYNFHSCIWHLLPFPSCTWLHSLWILYYQLWICIRGKCPW